MGHPSDSVQRPVLITGATGFLGRAIARRLLHDGRHVIGVCREGTRRGGARGRPGDVELLSCDLLDRDAARRMIQSVAPSACIHAAWEVTPGRYLTSPANEAWLNSSLHLAETLFAHGCRWLCALGTCFEQASPEDEMDRTPYVQAKRALRVGLADLAERERARFCWLRVHQPFGPGEHEQRLLPTLIRTCREGGQLTIRNGAAVRDFIHVEDVAAAVSAGLAAEIEGVFDAGTGKGTRLEEVVRIVTERMRPRGEIVLCGEYAAVEGFVADPEPLRAACGWTPGCSLEQWIEEQAHTLPRNLESREGTSLRETAGLAAPRTAVDVQCPICHGTDLSTIIAASHQPALLNLLYETAEQAKSAPRTRLDFRGCRGCGFVFDHSFDGALAVYGPGYINDQSCSPRFREHLHEVLQRLRSIAADRPGRIVEIGCGQGDFLRHVCAVTGRNGVGFDPACDTPGAPVGNQPLLLEPRLFTSADARLLAGAEEKVAMIFCRHVLEHLPDPVGMLRLMRQVAAAHDAAVVVEVPGRDWIFRQDAFFEFFHEHCSLFERHSMTAALARAGLQPRVVESGFGNQFLLVEAESVEASDVAGPESHASDFDEAAARLDRVARLTRDALVEAGRDAPVFFWGAGAKAVSVLNHLRLDKQQVHGVIDLNPRKQHRFLPLTGHRVAAPAELPALVKGADGRPTIVVMNPCYADEIARWVKSLGVAASLQTLTDLAREPAHH